LRLYVVCPSVCLSVTLVDQQHISLKSWKLIARTISPTPSLFQIENQSKNNLYLVNVDVSASTEAFLETVCQIAVR